MTQEDKELLLKYICMALPYVVKVSHKSLIRPLFSISPTQYYQITLDNAIDGEHNGLEMVNLDTDEVEIKPYLRPMSNMTDEELKEFTSIHENVFVVGKNIYTAILDIDSINWLLEHHFDFMGLISKGLAIEVTKENNPY